MGFEICKELKQQQCVITIERGINRNKYWKGFACPEKE